MNAASYICVNLAASWWNMLVTYIGNSILVDTYSRCILIAKYIALYPYIV